MAAISRRILRRRRPQRELRSPRRWSRFIGLLRWKEFFTLLFFGCMAVSSLGGALFFGVRSLQGYRKGLTLFYLTMLLFMSVCCLICHLLLVKWRLDRFFQEFSRSKSPHPFRSASTEEETASEPSSTPGGEVSAYTHADVLGYSGRDSSSCFFSRLKAILKLLHAYAVFLAALVISLLVLFDLATGYTASHFRPTLFSVISLTALQCWVVAVSFAWFINVLVFNDAADAAEMEHPLEYNTVNFPHSGNILSSRTIRGDSSRSSRRRDDGEAAERRSTRRGRDVRVEDTGTDACGKPQHPSKSRESEVAGKVDKPLWDMPSSDVSTCALASIRGVSSQWEDIEEAEAGDIRAGAERDNAASGLPAQGDFRGVSIQPTLIGVPSFAIACVPATPLALPAEEAHVKKYGIVHHSQV